MKELQERKQLRVDDVPEGLITSNWRDYWAKFPYYKHRVSYMLQYDVGSAEHLW